MICFFQYLFGNILTSTTVWNSYMCVWLLHTVNAVFYVENNVCCRSGCYRSLNLKNEVPSNAHAMDRISGFIIPPFSSFIIYIFCVTLSYWKPVVDGMYKVPPYFRFSFHSFIINFEKQPWSAMPFLVLLLRICTKYVVRGLKIVCSGANSAQISVGSGIRNIIDNRYHQPCQ